MAITHTTHSTSYKIGISYKRSPDLFIVKWLLRQNHTENRNAELSDMKVNIDTIRATTDTPIGMSIKNI